MKKNYSLTISIPTYGRYPDLMECIESIDCALSRNKIFNLTVKIFDNNETELPEEIENFINARKWCKYISNLKNIGSDRNILQAYTSIDTDYVMVLGDDDRLMPSFFEQILILLNDKPDVVVLSAYGFNSNYIKERPKYNRKISYKYYAKEDRNKFVIDSTPNFTFISTQVFATRLFSKSDLEKYLDTHLIQVAAFAHAVQKGIYFKYVKNFLVAGKRNNSGGYDSFDVFVDRLFSILKSVGIDQFFLKEIFRKLISDHYPAQYINSGVIVKRKYECASNYPKEFREIKELKVFITILRMPKIVRYAILYSKIVLKKIISGDYGFVIRYF